MQISLAKTKWEQREREKREYRMDSILRFWLLCAFSCRFAPFPRNVETYPAYMFRFFYPCHSIIATIGESTSMPTPIPSRDSPTR